MLWILRIYKEVLKVQRSILQGFVTKFISCFWESGEYYKENSEVKKKIVFSTVIIVLVIMANVIVYFWLNKEDSIFKDRLFIYEGTSYYAVDDTSMVNVSFILVDSKGKIAEENNNSIIGILRGEMGKENKLTDTTISLLNKYKSYSVYSVSGTVEMDDLQEGENNYTFLCVKNSSGNVLFDLPIGNVLVDKIKGINANKDVEIGYVINEYDKSQYPLNIDNNLKDVLIVEDVSFKLGEKGKISGKWLNNKDHVEGSKQEEELGYVFETIDDILYLQPIVYYKVNGNSYCEIAKTATCYLPDLGKQEIINYIKENIDGE